MISFGGPGGLGGPFLPQAASISTVNSRSKVALMDGAVMRIRRS